MHVASLFIILSREGIRKVLIRRCADWSIGGFRGGKGGPDPLLKSQNIGFISNTSLDPLKNHQATKPNFNVGPSLASLCVSLVGK